MKIVLGFSMESLRFVESNPDYILFSTGLSLPFELGENYDEFQTLIFKLNIDGRIRYFNKIKSMILESNTLKLYLDSGKVEDLSFDECFVYDTTGIIVKCSDLIDSKISYCVYDWVEITSIDSMPKANIEFERDFINKIWFSPKNYPQKTAVVRSWLKEEEIKKIEYSDTYIKFLLISDLQKLGYKGRKNGFNKSGKQIYLTLDLSCYKREVLKKEKLFFENTERVKFVIKD